MVLSLRKQHRIRVRQPLQRIIIPISTDVMKSKVEAVKNLKIDKVTVWDNMGSGKDGKSPATANFLSGMLGAIPPFEELFKMAGMELPNYLKGKTIDNTKEKSKARKDDNIEDVEPMK